MDKTLKEVSIGHRELLDTLQIIHVMKVVSNDKQDVDESVFLDSLIYELLNHLDNTESGCIVKLDNEIRFAIWLCIERYIDFLNDTGNTTDLDYSVRLKNTFGGQ